jgi:hypothetical protein
MTAEVWGRRYETFAMFVRFDFTYILRAGVDDFSNTDYAYPGD